MSAGLEFLRADCAADSPITDGRIVFMSEGFLLGGRRCTECGGTGECPRCFGTGKSVALNSDKEKCPHCNGTGICPTCSEATGMTTLGLRE